MNTQLAVQDWLQLSHDTRIRLAQVFNIPRSKGTMMEQMGEGSVLRSDGHTHEDLSVLTIEKMQEYLGTGIDSDMNFEALLKAIMQKWDDEAEIAVPNIVADPTQVLLEEWTANLARMNARAMELGLRTSLVLLIKQFFGLNALPINITSNDQTTAGLPKKGRSKKAK